MTRKLILLLGTVMCLPAMANDNICTTIGDDFAASKAIAWDSSSKIATLKTSTGDDVKGKVVASRDHNGGQKVNLVFEHSPPYYEADITEYIIFPVLSGYRAIGVTYVKSNGARLLDTSLGNNELNCVSL